MYSKRVTDVALNKVERQRNIQLTRHPISYIEANLSHLNNLMQEDGSLRRPLNKEESAFVRNERIICKLDFNYWRSRYCWIRNYAGNTLVRYTPNTAQQIMNDICAEMEEEGIADPRPAIESAPARRHHRHGDADRPPRPILLPR